MHAPLPFRPFAQAAGPLLLAQAVLLALAVAFRIVNADEGIFLHAAREVAGGAVPYRDVFFMQGPLTAYLFAPVAGLGWAGLFAARALGAAASLALTAGVGWGVYARTGRPRAAALAVALAGFNGLTLAWHPTATTLVWADALAFGGVLALSHGPATRRGAWVFGAGVLLGLAASARFTHGLVGVVALAACAMGGDAGAARGRRAFLLVAGGLLGFLPTLVLAAVDPRAFVLDTLVFRQVWGARVVGQMGAERVRAMGQFALYPQNALVLALAAWSALGRRWPGQQGGSIRRLRAGAAPAEAHARWTALACALGLGGFYAFLSPTQTHYFAATLPYLVLASAPALAYVAERFGRRALGTAGLAYALGAVPYAVLFIGGVRAPDARYRQATVRAVTGVLERCTAPRDTLLAFSPHGPVLARRPAMRGVEVGGVAVVPLLTPAERRTAGLLDAPGLRAALASGRAAAVVYEDGFVDDTTGAFGAYRLALARDGLRVYVRRTARAGCER